VLGGWASVVAGGLPACCWVTLVLVAPVTVKFVSFPSCAFQTFFAAHWSPLDPKVFLLHSPPPSNQFLQRPKTI
jgi:hypothetical protein